MPDKETTHAKSGDQSESRDNAPKVKSAKIQATLEIPPSTGGLKRN